MVGREPEQDGSVAGKCDVDVERAHALVDRVRGLLKERFEGAEVIERKGAIATDVVERGLLQAARDLEERSWRAV